MSDEYPVEYVSLYIIYAFNGNKLVGSVTKKRKKKKICMKNL